MKDIKNETEMNIALTKIAAKVIENVSKRILDQLKENIDKYVYRLEYYPNKEYLLGNRGKPSFEFRDKAWVWNAVQIKTDSVVKELFYDGLRMPGNDASIWFHGSKVKNYDPDSRSYLHEILNVDGYTSGLMTGSIAGSGSSLRHFSKLRKPYWDITIDELDTGDIKKMFDDEFSKIGIVPF